MDRDKEQINILKNPNNWPWWPYLSLKRYDGEDLILAYLWGDPRPPLVVYRGNIFSASDGDPEIDRYNSAEQLLAAGWQVD